jgi:hypothetical protein
MLNVMKGIGARKTCAQGVSFVLSFSPAVPTAKAVPGNFIFRSTKGPMAANVRNTFTMAY